MRSLSPGRTRQVTTIVLTFAVLPGLLREATQARNRPYNTGTFLEAFASSFHHHRTRNHYHGQHGQACQYTVVQATRWPCYTFRPSRFPAVEQ
jgi:hypothetical protein